MARLPASMITPDAALSQWQQLTPYMFALVTAAFGADWVTKETSIAGPPANTETTVKTEVTDNSATQTVKAETVE